MRRFAVLSSGNLVLWYTLFYRLPSSVRERVAKGDGGPQLLDIAVFPVASTIYFALVVGLVLAFLSLSLSAWQNIVAYSLGVLWCFLGSGVAREIDGNPDSKVKALLAGLVGIWLLVMGVASAPRWRQRRI